MLPRTAPGSTFATHALPEPFVGGNIENYLGEIET